MRRLVKIVRVEHAKDHTLQVWFADGSYGSWRSGITMRTGPMALPLHDAEFFGRAAIEDGALVWPNGWDASADFVREEMRRAGTLVTTLAAAE